MSLRENAMQTAFCTRGSSLNPCDVLHVAMRRPQTHTLPHLPVHLLARVLAAAKVPVPCQLLVSSEVRAAVLGGAQPLFLSCSASESLSKMQNATHCLARLPARRGGSVGVYVDEAVEASETPTINTEALAGFLTTRSPTVTALQMHCLRQLPPSWPACLQLAMPGLQRLSLYHIHSLGELELTGVPSLSSVVVTSCAILSYVGVSSATQLTRLDCSGCLNLLSLDITGCTALEVLNLEGTALTALPLQPQHNRLRSLNVNFNEQLTSLDLCHCTALRELQANIRYCTHLVLPPGCELDVLSLGRMKLLTPDVLADLVRVVEFTCSPPKYQQTGLEVL